MEIPKFLRKKKFYVTTGIIVVVIIIIAFVTGGEKKPEYETAEVERRDLVQTVEVTGEIKPASRINLSFKNGGTLNTLNVKVGDQVKQGYVLADLKDNDIMYAARSAEAALAVAVANLEAKLAGETPEVIRVAETDVEKAQATYNKALSDLESAKLTTADDTSIAKQNVQTAKNNLENQEAIQAQTVQNAYDTARAQLLTALGPLQTGLTDGDQIIGVDDSASNQTYKNVLGILETGSIERAKDSYKDAKAAKTAAENAASALKSDSSNQDIQTAGELLISAINKIQAYLTDVQKVLAATIPSQYFSASELETKKTSIDTDRVNVSTQYTTVLSAMQSTTNAELASIETIQQLEDAYQSTLTKLETAKTNAITGILTAETDVEIKKAALIATQASLQLKETGPRAVDVANLRASIQQARANYEKALNDVKAQQITAPVDGTIAEINPDLGERVTANEIVITMVGTDEYDIEALVPEADIAKIEIGQTAEITLDAYGDDILFEGIVTAENPDQTLVQEAVYYIARVQIKPNGKDIKPGMTANVTIKTGESLNTLVIPVRGVRTQPDGTKTVRILKNEEPVLTKVELGLRGDEGRVEVLEGLEQSNLIIVGETTP